jgi:hypothetical protein
MKCPTCHEDYATTAGFNAHVPSCGYRDNPLPEPEPEKENNGEKALKDLKADELKKIAEGWEIEGFANMTKAKLVEAIEAKQAENKHAELLAKAAELEIEDAENLSDEELIAAIEAAESNE